MNFLLKIVEGPMKGAEVALVDGLRVKVGSGEACDIVIADGTLPEVAFELDISATAVTLVIGDDTKTLTPFEITEIGTTAIAIGPAEGAWQPLRKPEPPKSAAPEEPVKPDAAPAPAETEEEKPSEDAGKPDEEPKRRRHGLGCLVALIVIAILVALLWYFWPRVSESVPALETARAWTVEKGGVAWEWTKGLCGRCKAKFEKPEPVVIPGPTLAEIAEQYGLTLVDGEPPVLKGNLARRTERMAIRSLALADNPYVRFDLTDDESLRAAADELLFVVTEGAIKAVAASNRVVTLTGHAVSAQELEKAVRALDADVKGIDRLVTEGVSVGGAKPTGAEEQGETAVHLPRPAKGVRRDPAAVYPIAGILTAPYPCVVMRTGVRLVEGAQIGKATLVKIEADKLTLKEGDRTFEWKP